jgi:NSS family neurotransmitter:Na+ symporter
MPIFFVMLILLAINSLLLPGTAEALAFYLNPDFSHLSNMGTWLSAFGQAFFSLSVGYGILLTYGSYLRKESKITKYSIAIAGADTAVALIGGLMIFPIVFSFGLNPAAGPELSFISLPAVFQFMPYGILIGATFFMLLFIAAVTSAVSMLEVGVSSFIDEMEWSRLKSVLLFSSITMVLGIPSALSYFGSGIYISGIPFLDAMDYFFGMMLLISSALICIGIVWFYKPEVLNIPIGWASRLRIPQFVYRMLKYIIPFVLILMLIFEVFGYIRI